MRLIGMLGGMSPESTILYYRFMNEAVQAATGDHLASARIVLHSVNFTEIAKLQRAGEWEAAGRILGEAARGLVAAGAELMVISANTMHICADQVRASIDARPLVHIGDAIIESVGKNGAKLLLLGTKYTMELPFLSDYLTQHGAHVQTPDQDTREWLQTTIYEELTRGLVTSAAKVRFNRLLEDAVQQGFDAVVLGCTELGMLTDDSAPIKLIDTAHAHALAAVKLAMSGQPKESTNGAT